PPARRRPPPSRARSRLLPQRDALPRTVVVGELPGGVPCRGDAAATHPVRAIPLVMQKPARRFKSDCPGLSQRATVVAGGLFAEWTARVIESGLDLFRSGQQLLTVSLVAYLLGDDPESGSNCSASLVAHGRSPSRPA